MIDIIHTEIVVEIWQIVVFVTIVSSVPLFVATGLFISRVMRHAVICDLEHVEPFVVPPRPRGYEDCPICDHADHLRACVVVDCGCTYHTTYEAASRRFTDSMGELVETIRPMIVQTMDAVSVAIAPGPYGEHGHHNAAEAAECDCTRAGRDA